MKRKILTIIIILLAIVAISIWILSFSSKNSGGGNLNSIREFIPFGNPSTENGGNSDLSVKKEDGSENFVKEIPAVRIIWDKPTSGFGVYNDQSTTTKNIIRFVDRATGHIYEANTNSLKINRLVNTTMPKIIEALWNKSNKNSFLARYLKENGDQIETVFVKIKKRLGSKTEEGPSEFESELTFLKRDILSVSIKPTGDSITYIEKTPASRTLIKKSRNDGGGEKIIYDSPIKEIILNWFSQNKISVMTKTSNLSAGFLYFLNINNNNLEKIIGPINTLNALTNPEGSRVIYSTNNNNIPSVFGYNLDSGEGIKIPVTTLPKDKCVWSNTQNTKVYCGVFLPNSAVNFPDKWYQGVISLNDSLWEINIETGKALMVVDFNNEIGKEMDLTKPQLSNDDSYIFFINKKDGSLWSVDLNKEY